jgi:prevent-host-death family protein
MKTVPAGEFKARCLALMDEVKATGEPILITKRGKPVARVVPDDLAPHRIDVDSIFESLRGLATIVGDPDDLIEPIIPREEWDHLKDDWSPIPPE